MNYLYSGNSFITDTDCFMDVSQTGATFLDLLRDEVDELQFDRYLPRNFVRPIYISIFFEPPKRFLRVRFNSDVIAPGPPPVPIIATTKAKLPEEVS